MKKLLTTLLAAGILATAGSTFAQSDATEPKPAKSPSGQAEKKERRGPGGPGAEERRERMKNMTPEEREAVRAKRQEIRAKMLERFDADGDGTLSPKERETMRSTLEAEGIELPRRGPAGGGKPKKDKDASED